MTLRLGDHRVSFPWSDHREKPPDFLEESIIGRPALSLKISQSSALHLGIHDCLEGIRR